MRERRSPVFLLTRPSPSPKPRADKLPYVILKPLTCTFRCGRFRALQAGPLGHRVGAVEVQL